MQSSFPVVVIASEDAVYRKRAQTLIERGMVDHAVLHAENAEEVMKIKEALTGAAIFIVDPIVHDSHGVELIKRIIATARVPVFCYCRVDNLLDPMIRGQVLDADALVCPSPPIREAEQSDKMWEKISTDWLKELGFASRLLRRSPYLDPLTGVYTREFAQHLFKLEYLRACRSKRDRVMVKLFVDMDDLKHVNTCYGYEAGDEAIKAIPKAIKRVLRATDIVSRSGEKADEFEVDLVEKRDGKEKMREASVVAQRIRHVGQDIGVLLPDGRTLHITVSVGCAVLRTFVEDADIETEQKTMRKEASEDMVKQKNIRKQKLLGQIIKNT